MTFAEVWQWIKDNSTTIEVIIIPLGIALSIGLWNVFTYFHKNGKEPLITPFIQIINGDNVEGDKVTPILRAPLIATPNDPTLPKQSESLTKCYENRVMPEFG